MQSANEPKVGYLGVDVLTNATIINELSGLLQRGLPLDIVSVRNTGKPQFHRNETIARIVSLTTFLYPLGIWEMAKALVLAPFVFPIGLVHAVIRAFVCPVDSWSERGRVIAHLLPALVLSMRWRGSVTHIHAQWAHTAATIAMHSSRMLRIGYSFTGHANDLFVHKVALAEKSRSARFVVSISEYHREIYQKLNAKSERLPVIHCGIDHEAFNPRPTAPQGTPLLLGVGRLVEKKGFHHLIEACAQLKAKGVNFECMIAGSGPEQERLQNLANELGVDSQVNITGEAVRQEDLPGLLSQATLMVLPCIRDSQGDMDGLPQVLMEAMAVGVPVVSTKLVGIPELVRNGLDGILVTSGSTDELVGALLEILAKPQKIKAMGQHAAQRVRHGYLRHQCIDQMESLLRHCSVSRTDPEGGFSRMADEILEDLRPKAPAPRENQEAASFGPPVKSPLILAGSLFLQIIQSIHTN